MTDAMKQTQYDSYGFYAVGLFDILGQAKALEGLSNLPKTEEEGKRYAEHLHRTVTIVNQVRALLGGFVDEFNKGRENPGRYGNLKEELRAVYDSLMSVDLTQWVFSDTVITFGPMMVPMDQFSIAPLHALLHGAMGTMILQFANGVAIRGAIDIGIGGQFWKGELYGPVLAQAHHLESRVAHWPRVLIGKGVRDYLEHWKGFVTEVPLGIMNQSIAKQCESFICQDEDGQWILDYLGQAAKKARADGFDWEGSIQKAFEFIKKEYEQFKQKDQQDLALRYSMVKRYFESRLRLTPS